MEENYKDYLNSPHWQEVRKKRLELDDNKCVICGSSYKLNVHHISYERIGKENIDYDLLTLCPICHKELHKLIDKNSRKVYEIKQKFKCDMKVALKDIATRYSENTANIVSDIALQLTKGEDNTKRSRIIACVLEGLKLTGASAYIKISPQYYAEHPILHSWAIHKFAEKRKLRFR